MGFQVPDQMPAGTPGRKFYAWLFVIVSSVVLLASGFDSVRTLPDNAMEACRKFRLCSPKPVGPLPDLQTDFVRGIGAVAAAQETLAKYRAANPDYDIEFHPDPSREKNSCANAVIKIDCRYSYGGTFSSRPKWRGLLHWLGL